MLFLVPDEGRVRTIEKAVAKWGASQVQMPKVRVHTVDGAVHALLPAVESRRPAKREPVAFTFSGEELEVFRSAYGELNAFVEEARRASAGTTGAVLPTRALRRMAALLARAADGGQRSSNVSARAEG